MKKKTLYGLGTLSLLVATIPMSVVISCTGGNDENAQDVKDVSAVKDLLAAKIDATKTYTSTKLDGELKAILNDTGLKNQNNLHTVLGLTETEDLSAINLNGTSLVWKVEEKTVPFEVDKAKFILNVTITLKKNSEIQSLTFTIQSQGVWSNTDALGLVIKQIEEEMKISMTKTKPYSYIQSSSLEGREFTKQIGQSFDYKTANSELGLHNLSKINNYGVDIQFEPEALDTVYWPTAKDEPNAKMNVRVFLNKAIADGASIGSYYFTLGSKDSANQNDLDTIVAVKEVINKIPNGATYTSTKAAADLNDNSGLGTKNDLNTYLGLAAAQDISNVNLNGATLFWSSSKDITKQGTGNPVKTLEIVITLAKTNTPVVATTTSANWEIIFKVDSSDKQQ